MKLGPKKSPVPSEFPSDVSDGFNIVHPCPSGPLIVSIVLFEGQEKKLGPKKSQVPSEVLSDVSNGFNVHLIMFLSHVTSPQLRRYKYIDH